MKHGSVSDPQTTNVSPTPIPVLLEVLEPVTRDQLSLFLEQGGLLSDRQYAFGRVVLQETY